MWNQKPSFRFEIDNFSDKGNVVMSKIFVIGECECEWYLCLYPKGGVNCDGCMCLFIANRQSLGTGWKTCVDYYFVLLNQSDKELFRSSIGQASFSSCPKKPAWGCKTLPLSKFQEKGFLENDKLIVEVYIKVVDGGEVKEDVLEKKETIDINGFQAFASQVTSVKKIFVEHVAKTEHVLSNACSKLSELAELGSKMDWLKSKLDEVSLKMKKADSDGSRVQQLEERVKNLEQMQSLFERDFLNFKLQESLEKKKIFDTDMSPRVKKLEERVKNLELMELGLKLECLESKLDEISLERKKSNDADESQVKQHEERIKNLELMISELKVELDREKAKSSFADDEFFLVDEVA